MVLLTNFFKNTFQPGGKLIGVLSALYIKQIKNIMKYQIYMNVSKNYR